LGEHFECFQPDTGDAGVERSLLKFLYGRRASNGFAAGRHDLTIRGVQRRQPGAITLGRSRREQSVGGLDRGPNSIGVRRLGYTANGGKQHRGTPVKNGSLFQSRSPLASKNSQLGMAAAGGFPVG
jgi:hypothetical protein